MERFLLYLMLTVVILATIRLARSRGRNPWPWGMASFVLALSPEMWKLLSITPLIILLLTGKLQTRPNTDQRRGEGVSTLPCPRCHVHNPTDHRYCIGCGWELRKPYVTDTANSNNEPQTTASSSSKDVKGQDTSKRPEADTARVSQAIPKLDPTLKGQSTHQGDLGLQTDVQLKEAILRKEATIAEPPTRPPGDAPVKEEPAQEYAPAQKQVYSGIPTAASMTERGMALFNQGRFQEAIDQFTKAIALDPRYKSAWTHRAEAYTKLGRRKEASEDLRRLEAI